MKIVFFFGLMWLASCGQLNQHKGHTASSEEELPIDQPSQPQLYVLGTVQDAGSPHAGCKKDCCKNLFENPDPNRLVTCLGIFDPEADETFLLEASPDLPRQMKALMQWSHSNKETPNGIFITHGHIGHYTGLMYLGRESMNADRVPVYLMPKMKGFIESNGPWDQLVNIRNIEPMLMENSKAVLLTKQLKITPLLVPHRDEYSETVGFWIQGLNKSALFIPDIDKWDKWEQSIVEWIKKVDYAFLDATFYDGKEVNNRDISEIPHPFVIESMKAFEGLSNEEKSRIHFIHLNHTNPLLDINSSAYRTVIDAGYGVAAFGEKFDL
jgi:pyrroloquinoline quinone biosynthesis protein B